MKMPHCALDAIGTTVKSEEYFRAFWDELLYDVRQLPSVTSPPNASSPQAETQDMLKVMVLHHAV